MKKFLVLAFMLVSFGVMNAQSMKMVVDYRGEVVGRYVKTNNATYTISIQDDFEVSKKGLRVVTYSAAKGQGIVYYNQSHTGSLNVRKRPTISSPAVAVIPDPKGNMPDCYECLGKVNGWYKVRVNGKVGYVRGDLLNWDGMCTM